MRGRPGADAFAAPAPATGESDGLALGMSADFIAANCGTGRAFISAARMEFANKIVYDRLLAKTNFSFRGMHVDVYFTVRQVDE